jgi:hypothetical protein
MSHTDLPPHAQLIQMGTAAFVTKVLYVAAKLGLADHLAGGARSADDLAAVLGAHPDSLHRFMRSLASFGVLTESAEGRFALTSLGRALESAAPGCARSTLITLGGAAFSSAFEHLEHAVRTGETLVVDNHRMLHGREAFDDPTRDFTRLLAWMPADPKRHRLDVVLELLTGVPPAKLAAREGITEAELYAWRSRALAAAAASLGQC